MKQNIFKGTGKKNVCKWGGGAWEKINSDILEKRTGKVRGLDISRVSLRTASRPVSSLGEWGSYRRHGRNLLYLRKEESKGKAHPQSSRGLDWVRAPSLDLSVPPAPGQGLSSDDGSWGTEGTKALGKLENQRLSSDQLNIPLTQPRWASLGPRWTHTLILLVHGPQVWVLVRLFGAEVNWLGWGRSLSLTWLKLTPIMTRWYMAVVVTLGR